ncbi:ABC transporter permease [Gudongella sp. SC589]|jgi:peptide/nickel transport system permease protein|uniref:ABC transporter permease n=1 Tax=Gudongella sp. SC589 TaxID=3385990 RepID=UPI003904944E
MTRKIIVRKLFYALLTILVVLVFNYILFRVLPGNPLNMMMRNPRATPETIAAVKEFYGLDQPWYIQFFTYFKHLLTGDLGVSFVYKAPVADVLAQKILPTVLMVGLAEIVAIVVGIFLGILAAWKRGTKLDVATLSFSLVTYSVPTFWLGMILVVIFCVQLRIFPTSGMFTPGKSFPTTFAMLQDLFMHLALPVLTMSLVLIGEYALTMRNTLMDVLSEDYITTARAKGFRERYILKKHALPNAMLPMITIIAINVGFVVAGAIQVETIFSWPGLGRLMYEALRARDYPLLQGVFLLVTVSVVLANVLADITYSYIDPRVKN